MDKKFIYYSTLSQRMFNYLNGKINRLNTNIYFQINDFIPGYGELYMRSVLNLNLPKILNQLNEKTSIETNILFVICHELYHADQEVIDENYLDSEYYSGKKEAETNYRAIIFILNNLSLLESEFGIKISKEDLLFAKEKIDKSFGINSIADYRRYSEYEIIDKLLESFTRRKIYWDKYPNVLLVVSLPYNDEIYFCPIKDNDRINNYSISILQNLIIQFNRLVKLDSTNVYTEEENSFVIKVNITESIPGIEY